MAKEFAKKFYNSKKWKDCRNSYVQQRMLRDGGLCEDCKENVGYIVHHIIELSPGNITDPDIATNHDNLMFVCKECHDLYDGHWLDRKNKSELIVEFDREGNPIGYKKE